MTTIIQNTCISKKWTLVHQQMWSERICKLRFFGIQSEIYQTLHHCLRWFMHLFSSNGDIPSFFLISTSNIFVCMPSNSVETLFEPILSVNFSTLWICFCKVWSSFWLDCSFSITFSHSLRILSQILSLHEISKFWIK